MPSLPTLVRRDIARACRLGRIPVLLFTDEEVAAALQEAKQAISEARLLEGWITLSSKDAGGEKHGSTHVFIGHGGKIEKGPAGMTGKTPDDLKSTHKVTARHGDKHPETGDKEGPKEASKETPKQTPKEPAKSAPKSAPVEPWGLKSARRTAETQGIKLGDDFTNGAAAWSHGLTDDQRQAVLTYSSGNFADINGALRSGKPLGDYEDTYKALSEAIDKAPSFKPVHAFRGMRFADKAEADKFLGSVMAAADSGDAMKLNGITSMSLSQKMAEHFLNEEHGKEGVGVMMRIKAHSGAFISAENGPHALELAHKHGQEYHVHGVEEAPDGTVIINLSQVK